MTLQIDDGDQLHSLQRHRPKCWNTHKSVLVRTNTCNRKSVFVQWFTVYHVQWVSKVLNRVVVSAISYSINFFVSLEQCPTQQKISALDIFSVPYYLCRFFSNGSEYKFQKSNLLSLAPMTISPGKNVNVLFHLVRNLLENCQLLIP